ncbi:MAG: phytase [Chloroflexaceae bacterium]|nr:phytase [Chloroflexaceae bacterium]
MSLHRERRLWYTAVLLCVFVSLVLSSGLAIFNTSAQSSGTLQAINTDSPDRQTVSNVEFLGQVSFPSTLEVANTTVGGLSGITYDAANDTYYAISDDRSSINNARFYTLDIDLSDGSLDNGDITFQSATILRDANGDPFVTDSLDPEGIALADDGTLYISSEGNTNNLIAPFVNQFLLNGQQIDALPVPAKYLPTADASSGVRNNLAFESLTRTPNSRFLYTATEAALFQDGTAPTLDDGSLSRIVKYDLATESVVAEYVYEIEPIPNAPVPPTGFADNGLVELLALDNNGTFLALERSFSEGVGVTAVLYQVLSQGALDVQTEFDLFYEEENVPFSIDPAVQKEELLNFGTVVPLVDNLEALSFGPQLPDGRQVVIAVSDNNFNDLQVTQFIALALTLETTPAALPVLETPGFIDDANATNAGDVDDPAIWAHPTNPDDSLVITVVKDGGLVVFDLEGTILQKIQPAPYGDIRYNNVDLIYNFRLPTARLTWRSPPTVPTIRWQSLRLTRTRANSPISPRTISPKRFSALTMVN